MVACGKDQGLFQDLFSAFSEPFAGFTAYGSFGMPLDVLYLYVALGAALGGVCRYLGTLLISRWAGEFFPWGTLLVNLLGSFLLGAILGVGVLTPEQSVVYIRMEVFAGVGFCGGLTTFSTFSLQNLNLLSKGERGKLALNLMVSVGGCLLAVTCGYVLTEGWVV